jgi:hypothetical protein
MNVLLFGYEASSLSDLSIYFWTYVCPFLEQNGQNRSLQAEGSSIPQLINIFLWIVRKIFQKWIIFREISGKGRKRNETPL